MKPNILSKSLAYTIILFCVGTTVSAQMTQKIGGNPFNMQPSAILELESTTKGFLLPRMTAAQMAVIASPPAGMMVYCTDCGSGIGELRVKYTSGWGIPAINLSGDVTAAVDENGSNVTTIGNDKVTYAKIQNVSASDKVLGRVTSGAGDVEEIATTGTGNVVRAASPTFTGAPSLPTGTTGVTQTSTDSSTKLATTAFVATAISNTPFKTTSGVTSNSNGTTATDDFVFGSTSLNDITGGVTTDDSRMYFDKSKAAFRAGFVDSTQWDDANVGAYSTAFGYKTTASQGYSTAMGKLTTASGGYSTAMGASTIASGGYSTAMGISTTASGTTSTAMGNTTTASGENSTAMGNGTSASVTNSTAMGNGSAASGTTSTAMGNSTNASGDVSTAIGNATTASGSYSTAMGNGTIASGNGSTAMGQGTTAESFIETVIGAYDTTYTPSSTSASITTDRLFVIGNGTSSGALSDALVVLKDGNTTLKGTLKLTNGTSSYTLPNTDGTANQVLKTDGSGTVTWGNAAVREIDDEYTATVAQTSFTLTQTPSANSKVKMYINGIRISKDAFTRSNAILTYVPANNGAYALTAGDRIQIDYYY